ncbi:hypothetical protein E2C01_009425 [Portunus trituberculatus]|uniref:Uncharacterized protein n=1 Tax=Portunus trituberculatus TaxID=210409 RepID=A0A5B7D5J5_PORTR|nr:hypothetical protein [Portunus trituberculatus]
MSDTSPSVYTPVRVPVSEAASPTVYSRSRRCVALLGTGSGLMFGLVQKKIDRKPKDCFLIHDI